MKNDENIKPPEMLAAYADGELEPRERRAAEQWLADHLEARADVDAQWRLAKLWHETQPREPDEGTWAAAVAGIQARFPVESPSMPRRRLPFAWLVGLAAAAAAAVIWIVANRTPPPGPTPQPGPLVDDTPFAAASHEDILITSLADTDPDDLPLVGEPPIRGPLALADHGDIHGVEVTPDPGMNPTYHQDPGATPMIITQPPAAAEVKQP